MELNDTLLTATDSGIVDSAPGTYVFSGEIGDNIYGVNDVDLFSATLLAGESIVLDIDARVNGSSLDSVLRVFDSVGNELAENDITPTSLDSLLTFTPPEDGLYYFGVSDFANLFYDPNVENSGFSANLGGEYDLIATIASDFRGTNANNTINATSLPDIIQGLGGNDTINARAGNDTVHGGSGRDFVLGAAGDDSLFGGLGADTLIGGLGADTLNGAENRDSLIGGHEGDLLIGQQGRDTLRGGRGNDELRGGTDNDFLFGGTANDTLFGSQGDDLLHGEGGRDRLLGESGSDTLRGGGNDDFVSGGAGADLLFGNKGNDQIQGGTGADTLNGQSANDTLRGQAGDDQLHGGSGSDLLIGGSGRDQMTGGAGADLFVYKNSRHGLDTITDFEGLDRIVLTDLLSPVGSPTFNSSTPFEDYVRLVQTGANTQVRFDVGGDQVNNQFVTLATLQNVDVSSLSSANFIF